MDSELIKENFILKEIIYHTYSMQSILKILIQRLTIIFILRGMKPIFILISQTKNEQHHDILINKVYKHCEKEIQHQSFTLSHNCWKILYPKSLIQANLQTHNLALNQKS
jgi:hypothetical protein